jgi:hypothetical protein
MFELLHLDLRSPLSYLVPAGEKTRDLQQCWPLHPLAEGDEELYAFDADRAIVDDTENGPAIARPLPNSHFAAGGRGKADRAADEAAAGAIEGGYAVRPIAHADRSPGMETFHLPAGGYAFAQFQADDMQALVAAMDDFVKECWWQRVLVSGPLYLRRVGEDGAAKLQLLRRSPARGR